MGLSGGMDEGGVERSYLTGDQAAFISNNVELHAKITRHKMFS